MQWIIFTGPWSTSSQSTQRRLQGDFCSCRRHRSSAASRSNTSSKLEAEHAATFLPPVKHQARYTKECAAWYMPKHVDDNTSSWRSMQQPSFRPLVKHQALQYNTRMNVRHTIDLDLCIVHAKTYAIHGDDASIFHPSSPQATAEKGMMKSCNYTFLCVKTVRSPT